MKQIRSLNDVLKRLSAEQATIRAELDYAFEEGNDKKHNHLLRIYNSIRADVKGLKRTINPIRIRIDE